MTRSPDREWTAEEVATVREMHPQVGCIPLARLLQRSVASINSKVGRLGISRGRQGKHAGTSMSDRLLEMAHAAGAAGLTMLHAKQATQANGLAPSSTVKTLARLADSGRLFSGGNYRSLRYFVSPSDADAWSDVACPGWRERKQEAEIERVRAARARTLAAHLAAKWKPQDIETLREQYPARGATYLSKLLGRTAHAVSHKAAELGVRYSPPKQPKQPKPLKVKTPKASQALQPSRSVQPKQRGPFAANAEVTYLPTFKFTRAPTPPAALRTNTYSIY